MLSPTQRLAIPTQSTTLILPIESAQSTTHSKQPKEKRLQKRFAFEALYSLVGRARFELATNGLKVRCSTG